MADGNTTDDVMNSEQRESTGASRAAGKGKDKAAEQAKKAMKKAKEAQKKGKYAKGIGKILWPILAIVIIIVMVIGFISFALNMPGAVVDKIMDSIDTVKTTIKQWWEKKDLSTLKPDDMHEKKLELLQYLDEMGYDVVGMGFVSSVVRGPSEEDENKQIITDFTEDITKNDVSADNTYPTIQPSYLFSYYLANERIYIDKHANFFAALIKNTGATSTWGEGMLNIYGDTSIVDSTEVDRDNLTLTFKNMHGFFKTDVYQYNIDGWAGRYGTPLELLLAIHSSTMMPDLVYEFISNENLQTVVNIDAQEVKLQVGLKLIGPDNTEANLNLGTENDEAIPIEFYRDEKTGDYGISNKDEIINGLKDNTYTVASLRKAFWQFEDTLYDYAQSLGVSGVQQKIQEIVSEDSSSIYLVAGETSALQCFGDYLGTYGEVQEAYRNGTRLYNDTISIDRIDGDIAYFTNHYYLDGRLDRPVEESGMAYRVCALKSWQTALRDGTKIVEGENEEEYKRFSEYWKDLCVKPQYSMLFQQIDEYMYALVYGQSVNLDELNYKGNEENHYWYQDKFNAWVDTLQAPLTFNEYIEQNGLQDAISYEKDGKYKNYMSNWAAEQVVGLNEILEQIKEDIELQKSTTSAAQKLKNNLASEIGLTAEQVDLIYDEFLVKEPEIKTFVPQIKSVVKHWYKDLVFQYKNAAKGTVFETEYPGEGIEGYTLYYEFKTLDENYPVQDGEPYVIKGDSVTQDGKTVNTSDVQVDEGTKAVLEDYTLGTGYKTARKLFTQGYYYQYDGSTATAEEIANAKRIESYDEGEIVRVQVTNGKITYVYKDLDGNSASSEPTSIIYKKDGHNVDDKNQADTVVKYYYIAAPKKYVSPANGTYEETVESVESINKTLKLLGSDLRRKKVTMSSNTTSLTALSMLEGMHSLDADYIYREFKEFLIELGYYSRAEIESVETNVLDWFIPGFTPEQWPPVKSEEQMLEYGTELLASANIKDTTTVSAEKMTSLDNFIFYTDTSGVIDATTLSTAGTNIQCITGELKANDIAEKIINNTPTAICIYANFNAKDDENAVVKTKQLIQDIRTKLKEANYKSPDIAIYVLQVLPLEQPNLLADESKEIVEQNKRISNYNTSLYNVCLSQDNVKFIDATSGCVTDSGWLNSKFTASKLSENIISKIVKKNVSNGGFEPDITVITPGAGYITAITDKEITIEFSVEQDPALRSIDGFSMVISGIAVDEELRNKFASEAFTDEEGNVKLAIEKSSVIGITTTENIKLIMRDRNKAILGNIEDYMGLPKSNATISDWEIYYFIPYESGAVDAEGGGPGCAAILEAGEECAVGICQWTTKSSSGLNRIPVVCGDFYDLDPTLCAELNAFRNYSISDIFANFTQIQNAFTTINTRDHEAFLQLQLAYALEEKSAGIKGDGVEWIFDRAGVCAGTYMSLENWRPAWDWQGQINESMTDKQIVIALLKYAWDKSDCDANYCDAWRTRWDSQARFSIDVLDGVLSEEEIEEWVRQKNNPNYQVNVNTGYINSNLNVR